MKIGTCRLCLQEKALLKKSHIIPEFMYEGLFDENHKMYSFKPQERAKGEGYVKRPSSGVYDRNLLCASCDNVVLGKYETYGHKALYAKSLPPGTGPTKTRFRTNEGLVGDHVKNIDYKNFKLFLLSILWRASISTQELFSEINLGVHEDKIRNMILNCDPGEVEDYPIFFLSFLADKKFPKDFIAHPQKRKFTGGYTVYVFMIGGIIYNFYVNSKSHRLPDEVVSTTINPSNSLYLYHLPKGKSWEVMLGYYGVK
jgi:hypothetical protein